MLLRLLFAVMWPCGVIVHISEIFMAECKTQVYGQLHDLLWTHASTAQQLITSFQIYMYIPYLIFL